jgi:hypothetical protein
MKRIVKAVVGIFSWYCWLGIFVGLAIGIMSK